MFPMSCKMGGVCFGFPDVCLTPAPESALALPAAVGVDVLVVSRKRACAPSVHCGRLRWHMADE